MRTPEGRIQPARTFFIILPAARWRSRHCPLLHGPDRLRSRSAIFSTVSPSCEGRIIRALSSEPFITTCVPGVQRFAVGRSPGPNPPSNCTSIEIGKSWSFRLLSGDWECTITPLLRSAHSLLDASLR